MEKKHYFAFGKENFILLAISLFIIILGFVLMAGGKSTEETGFDPSIFSTRRITVAPIVTLIGFIFVIYAIVKKPKADMANSKENESKINKK